MYIGVVLKGASLSRELRIPISNAAAAALCGTPLEVSIELRDAHHTAPTTPVRFRGPLQVDAP